MYIGKHQVAQRVVHHAVTLQRRRSFECIADDGAGEMSAAVARTFMTDVLVRFIDDIEPLGRQCCLESFAYQGDTLTGHGRTLRKGFTRTSA